MIYFYIRSWIKNSFLYPLVKPIWRIYFKKRSKYLMAKYAQKCLESVKTILEEHDILFWLNWGTLLGAYRDRDFIPYDSDIDIGVFSDDAKLIKEIMKDTDFCFSHEYQICDGESIQTIQLSYTYNSLVVDFYFYIYSLDKTSIYGYDLYELDKNTKKEVGRYELPLNGFETIILKGKCYNIPSNTRQFLEAFYGVDFMIPKPDFLGTPLPCVKFSIEELYGIVNLKR